MSDTATEAPGEPVLPAPQAVAEAEAGAPDAASLEAGEQVAAPATPEAERTLPFEIEHAIGPLRRAILDHPLDTDEPQSVGQILAALPAGTSRNTAETCIRREHESGRIECTSPGHYVLAKPRPPEPKPAAPPPEPARDEMTNQAWLDVLEAFFVDPTSWDAEKLGAPPDQPANRIPWGVKLQFNERLRKREERAKERKAADAALRDQLIAATGGNYTPGAALGADPAGDAGYSGRQHPFVDTGQDGQKSFSQEMSQRCRGDRRDC
jgi:hypothetical protein